jgi:hypothetical protein
MADWRIAPLSPYPRRIFDFATPWRSWRRCQLPPLWRFLAVIPLPGAERVFQGRTIPNSWPCSATLSQTYSPVSHGTQTRSEGTVSSGDGISSAWTPARLVSAQDPGAAKGGRGNGSEPPQHVLDPPTEQPELSMVRGHVALQQGRRGRRRGAFSPQLACTQRLADSATNFPPVSPNFCHVSFQGPGIRA